MRRLVKEKLCVGFTKMIILEWTEDEGGFVGYGEAILDEETGLWTLSPPAMISLVGSLVFGFTVGSSVVTSPIVAKIGYRYSGLGTVLKNTFYFRWFKISIIEPVSALKTYSGCLRCRS